MAHRKGIQENTGGLVRFAGEALQSEQQQVNHHHMESSIIDFPPNALLLLSYSQRRLNKILATFLPRNKLPLQPLPSAYTTARQSIKQV